MFLPQETGTFGNIEKEPLKPRQNGRNMYIMCLPRIFALLAIQSKW